MLSTNQASKRCWTFGCSRESQNEYSSRWSNRDREIRVYEISCFSYSERKEKERTLVVEDNPELYLHRIFPEHHFVPMQCRASEVEENAIDFDRLLTNALRQGPKRLIVGESRGKEALK